MKIDWWLVGVYSWLLCIALTGIAFLKDAGHVTVMGASILSVVAMLVYYYFTTVELLRGYDK